MLNEKIKYYRKKNMMTQEELAEQLQVSRQIITKWESGIVLPGIEYLIDLSSLFGVSIDSLVKDDDCKTLEIYTCNLHDLKLFLAEAKQNTYAKKMGKVKSCRKGSIDYFYQRGKYSYLDSFVGSSKFSGEEVVYEEEAPIWSMNYYGKVLDERFDGDFLKEVLLQVQITKPFRGPECYNKGNYYYYNVVDGDIDDFIGKETIFYLNIKIYECYFHGGKLE